MAIKIGVIGYGQRGSHVMKRLMALDPVFECAGIYDMYPEKIDKRDLANTVFHDTAESLLEARLDAYIVASYCNSHSEYAVKVMGQGAPLYLEKPVSVNDSDLQMLSEANKRYNADNIVVSFPLRHSPIVAWVKEIIGSGKIGSVDHVQAVNNVPYGRNYFSKWYRFDELAGGLFLQKATHDFDYINHVLNGVKPVDICAMISKQYYKGDMPAGLKCSECDKSATCRESPENVKKQSDDVVRGEYCVFASDCDNEDSGSALVRYESGMHLSYSQNFIARKEAAARGARFIGYEGTVEFDFRTRTARLMMHHSGIAETKRFDIETGHGGGDAYLINNFADIARNGAKSITPLDDGLLSALMCIRAKQSAENRVFTKIDYKNFLRQN